MPLIDRPVYKGLPVPYVAMWSDELWKKDDVKNRLKIDGIATQLVSNNPFVKVPAQARAQLKQAWPDVSFQDHPNVRDELGVLWQPDGDTQTGEPIFGDVNCIRQVKCMKEGRCQVCGDKIDPSDGWDWLMPDIEYRVLSQKPRSSGSWTTPTPPVCSDCVSVAQNLCPVLKRQNFHVKVKSYEIVAAWGVLTMIAPEAPGMVRQMKTDVPIGHESMKAHIGKQLVVRLELM